MRIIKFRAFDKTFKKMFYADTNEQFFKVMRMHKDKHYSDEMQFTGLLDKFGKEIYEKDIVFYGQVKYIVKYGSYDERAGMSNISPLIIGASFYLDANGLNGKMFQGLNVIDKIIDVDGYMHRFMPDMSIWENRMNTYHQKWAVEVIGNIYENPELLK